MHIPDGFLDTRVAITTGLFSATGLSAALRQLGRRLQPRQIPLIGLTAAFVFVAQMINFPVAGGTSGHLIGGALTVVLLGPSAAIIVMTSVLIIQALIFADGGLLSLGANILNMALVAPLCAFWAYRLMRRFLGDYRGQLIAASLAAWISTIVASIFCAGELALSHTVPWNLVFPAMAGIHSMIGIGESLITMLVIAAIRKTRPELLEQQAVNKQYSERKTIVVYGVLVILGLLIFVVPFASSMPDGLERVAQAFGFEYRAGAQPQFPALLKDYSFPGILSAGYATIVAGLIGAILVFALSFILARVLIPKQKSSPPTPEQAEPHAS